MIEKPSRFRTGRRGAAGSQYAVILGLVVVVALLAIQSVGGSVEKLLTNVSNRLTNVTQGGNGGGTSGSGGSGDAPGNQPPEFQTGAAIAGTLGSPLSVTIGATDPEGGAVTYSGYAVTNGSIIHGLAYNAGSRVLSGTPGQTKSYSFSLTATDPEGLSATRVFTVTVPTVSLTLANDTYRRTDYAIPAAVVAAVNAGQTVVATFTNSGFTSPTNANKCGMISTGVVNGANSVIYSIHARSQESSSSIVGSAAAIILYPSGGSYSYYYYPSSNYPNSGSATDTVTTTITLRPNNARNQQIQVVRNGSGAQNYTLNSSNASTYIPVPGDPTAWTISFDNRRGVYAGTTPASNSTDCSSTTTLSVL